ncbi:MAG: ATP-dependent DNA ligase [Candidatus Bathyarchaeia archaeon]
MQTSFRSLAELCEKLEATRKRLLMISLVAEFLKTLETQEIEPAISMILGRPFPKWSQQTPDVSWATLSEIIGRVTGARWEVFSEAFRRTGDIGSATKAVFEGSRLKRQTVLVEKSLTITEVRKSFKAIAETAGTGSREKKERLAETLLSSASPLEAKYLIKVFIGEMRTGFHEGLMEQTVAEAYDVPLDTVQQATMIVGDVGEVATTGKLEGAAGLCKINFRAFRPVSLMLAQMANSVAEAMTEHGGKTAFEYKYDGARVQIHKLGNNVKVFSRRLTDVTESLPEAVEAAKENVDAEEAIVEGEIIAVDDQGHPIPFQHLMRRFRRVHSIEEMGEKIPVRLYLFDILFADGQNFISLPYSERRAILAERAGRVPLTRQLVTDNVGEAEKLLSEAMSAGHEGLMAKRLDSPYTPGIRGKHWLKIKPILEPLDLVIVAADYGYGRRHGWLSDYYLAARDAETGDFLEVGKTFKGLTDAEIVDMTRRLKDLAVHEERGKVVVVPKIVLEIAYNEIQRSPKYKCGMALRFARITRIRDDKTAEEADTIQRVEEIFERQFLKKGRYKTDLTQK